jgi:hypothetical protein
MVVEKAAFIQKKSRKNKFNILFQIIGLMSVIIIYFNLSLKDWRNPPMEWYTNSKLKCNDIRDPIFGMNIGLKESFYDTSILMCLPAMIFGVSFSISMEPENIKWTKT